MRELAYLGIGASLLAAGFLGFVVLYDVLRAVL